MSLEIPDLARILPELRASVEADILADTSAPAATLELFRLHWEKPWVPNFLTSLISPLKPTLRTYLKLSVLRHDGRIWYIPSVAWWRMHARSLHAPEGAGCLVAAHVYQLCESATMPLFLYADILQDGRFRVLGEDDFKIEAGYWKANFKAGAPAGDPPVTQDE